MTEIADVPGTYEEAVQTLARWHAEGGPADLRVFSFPDPAGELVRLIEVSDEFLPTGTIRPLTLGRSDLFPFRSAVALAAPGEWAAAEAGRLGLPPGFDLAAKRQVWP